MIITEDGTGLVAANSYVTVQEADDYFLDRANATWSAASYTAKETALIKATDYIELRFASKFKSLRLYPDNPQALSFPRVDYLTTPVGIKRATYEYAVRALSGELTKDKVATDHVNTKTVRKVGPIETVDEISYPTNFQKGSTYNTYVAADDLIKPYLKSSNNMVIR